MPRTHLAILATIALLALPGCASLHPSVLTDPARTPMRTSARWVGKARTAVIPPLGAIYSRVSAPISSQAKGTLGPETGRATAFGLGLPPNPWTGIWAYSLVSWGDMSARRALTRGGTDELGISEYELEVILFVFRRITLVTYGRGAVAAE